jgi:multidrug resistance protein, MATE family
MTIAVSDNRWGFVRSLSGLALPVVLANVSQTMMGLVDTLMVGQLGASSLAAVGVATLAFSAVASALKSFDVAVQTIVARRVGEGRDGEVGAVVVTGLALALVLGCVFTVIGMLWPDKAISLVSSDPEVRTLGVDYLMFRVPGMLAFMAFFILRGAFDGMGWTRIGMFAGIGMNVVNALLNWVLIFGQFGVEPLGVGGAGLASSLASVSAVIVLVMVALRTKTRQRFRMVAPGNLQKKLVRPLLTLAWPAAVQVIGALSAVLVFFAILGRISTIAVAAASVVFRIAALSFMPAIGMGVAVQTMVSQSLGRSEPDTAGRAAWTGVSLAMIVMGLFGIVFLAIPRTLMGFFATDPELVAAGTPILRMMGLVQIFDAVGLTLAGAVRGAGANRVVMTIDVVSAWMLFLPSAWYFGIYLDWGLSGAWIGVLTWFFSYALTMTVWFRRGTWRTYEV